ncbi:efflux RND transporter periplasmic adaptor subunit [Ferruginivarius sediminum]|uniref:HlyD family efflux transporter periplasmic adaptor subunit n=1 Tax=Ferruginivarius sediminum TaxID=2661937 RepID=A0A369T886_9PROT|nr:efflux RND transporter periplasmic adaptor subunit [Ferruginivarius sediminum]RDD61488.1 HlyD family efflux transporter periplasmic adaptor subunit [Ferruginivarius sediminum]
MKSPRFLIAVLVLAAMGAGGYWAYSTYAAQKDDGVLTLYGNVDIRQVDLAFNAEGKITEVLVEEGDDVGSDQLLARLDKELYKHAVAAARARVQQSEARLRELENGTRPEEIDRARAALQQAKASVEETEATLERRRRLLASNNVSEQAFDEAKRAYEETKALRDQREAELALALEGPRSETIAATRAELDFNRATLRFAHERLDNTELLAPAAGTILTRIREPGATVAPTTSVLTLAIRDPVRVRTYVDGPNLGKVVPGMKAEVTTDSYPDKAYTGHIGYISPTAEFTPKSVETPELRTDLVYRVRVIVENPDDGLRQGMPVTVRLPDTAKRQGSGG